ncbi:PREDICTED: uncharacterized protein LOC108570569 [Habropoda laboriosa]|uniref:uncharacterized protein LOC108570569 n=1 Tax=Habropoda laboriosa TaxID=597456 RepID=UPI00083DE57E|nr:PREDICTED: uncharacterized protein LOC108570569 [Habropoda laboriosa]
MKEQMEFGELKKSFTNMEVSFPIFPTTPPKSTSPTKINFITSSIPLSDARIMNLIFLSVGVSLNLLIISVIAFKSSMRTSINLYIVSFACSNMVILIEPLEEMLRWFFNVNMKLNMDYVCMISFDVSVITIAILKFMLYTNIFQEQISFGRTLLKRFTSIKGILLIWCSCIISLAIGLHIYDFFEGDMADIYVWNTIMFIAMPFIIFVAIDSLILYELVILKMIEGSWRKKYLRHYVMLVITAIAFFLIRTPYRLARAINFIEPKALCCTDSRREVLYFMAKTFPIISSIIYISSSAEFQKAFQEILNFQCRRSTKETNNDTII